MSMKFSAEARHSKRQPNLRNCSDAAQWCIGSDSAIPAMVGRLMDALVAKRLLTAHEVTEIFDYDVVAED